MMLVRRFNFYPFTIALAFKNAEDVLPVAYNSSLQMQRLTVFAGKEGQVTVYSPWTFYAVKGGEFLSIPFIIISFLILNVLLTAVYERTKEIHIFSTVGCDPKSIMLMFLVESVIYAIIGAGLGYLFGILTIFIIDHLHLTPSGFYLNYASTFVVIGIGLLMAMVILSTIYPAWQASRLVTPSLKRRWELSTKPHGDRWLIPLPFTLEKSETRGALMYLKEFAEASTATYGIFKVMIETIKYEKAEKASILSFNTMLAPYDLGIQQTVKIVASPTLDGESNAFVIDILRLTGQRDPWMLANYRFVDRIRKQLLLWRALPPEAKKKYFEKAKEVMGE
jgi:hypothetical protein